ncbi:MAG: hypothetical protein HY921_11385 [Elusimicrobia bacterium]|nr:hypothetical protein [Elusimicrobiota bacterium]
MNTTIYRGVRDLKGFSLKSCPAMPEPAAVLMCPPDYYDVVDVKNPLMAGKVGTVNKSLAHRQWEDVCAAFERAGKSVRRIEPIRGLEDMVFCSNQTFAGLTPEGEKVCLLGQMRHSSRKREVPAFEEWFKKEGYRVARLKDSSFSFEGSGDAIWHPGKRLIWGGHGFRSEPEVYGELSEIFKAPVILLKLVNEKFYHLDTCFCPLNQEAVLIYPAAFDSASLEVILKIFPVVLTASESEASRSLACNAAIVDSRTAIVQKGTTSVARHMQVVGLQVIEADTSEFIKSGGSVYCMKMFLY